MKIKPEHLEQLKLLVAKTDTEANRARYRARDPSIPNVERIKDVNMRYRWDCMWGDKGIGLSPQEVQEYVAVRRPLIDELYTYMNDTHIDTALKACIPNIE